MRVIGVGNRWRSDDGVGLVVADAIAQIAPSVEVLLREGEPVGLIDAWDGADAVVLVDAVSSGALPGTVHRYDAAAGPLPAGLFRRSTHHLGLADALELARAMGRLPAQVVVVGVEGKSWIAGEGLSDEVEAALANATAVVLDEVERCTSAR